MLLPGERGPLAPSRTHTRTRAPPPSPHHVQGTFASLPYRLQLLLALWAWAFVTFLASFLFFPSARLRAAWRQRPFISLVSQPGAPGLA